MIFGLIVLLHITNAIICGLVKSLVVAGGVMLPISILIWNGVWGAFTTIAMVATYHELRVAKEGPDLGKVAAVFD